MQLTHTRTHTWTKWGAEEPKSTRTKATDDVICRTAAHRLGSCTDYLQALLDEREMIK